MAGLSESEIASLRREFLSFDSDGDGTISAEELATVLRSFGDDVTEDEVRKVINTFDIDGNGTIEFNEFLIMNMHLSLICFIAFIRRCKRENKLLFIRPSTFTWNKYNTW